MLQRTPPLSRTSSRAIALYALLASFTVSAQSPPLETLDQAQAFALSVVVQADTDEAKAFELIKAHTERAREYSTISLAELDAIGQQFSTNAPQRLVGMGKPTGNVEFIQQKTGRREHGSSELYAAPAAFPDAVDVRLLPHPRWLDADRVQCRRHRP